MDLVLWLAVVIAGLPQAAPQSASPPALTSPGTDYTFRTPTGLLIFHVRAERAEEFEGIARRIVQVLSSATDPTRREQAGGWRFLRSNERVGSAVIYVAIIDPIVAGADYDPVRVLTELVPAEASALYERLRDAVVKVERLALAPVR